MYNSTMNWIHKAIEATVRAEADSLLVGDRTGPGVRELRRESGEGVLKTHGLHKHFMPELCLAVAGRSAMHVGENVYSFSAPQVAILPAYVRHAEGFRDLRSSYALLWLHFHTNNSLLAVISEYAPGSGWQISERDLLESKAVRDLRRKLDAASSVAAIDFEAIRADLLVVLAAINRQHATGTKPAESAAAKDADHVQLLRRVQDFLDANYTRDIDVESVAMIARLSPNYLNTLFSRWKGQGIREYIITRRMERAMELCNGGGLLVKEVSQKLGYADPFYFSRAFHRYHGCWPTEAGLRDR
jgi:AraC-like DNA-binding protein